MKQEKPLIFTSYSPISKIDLQFNHPVSHSTHLTNNTSIGIYSFTFHDNLKVKDKVTDPLKNPDDEMYHGFHGFESESFQTLFGEKFLQLGKYKIPHIDGQSITYPYELLAPFVEKQEIFAKNMQSYLEKNVANAILNYLMIEGIKNQEGFVINQDSNLELINSDSYLIRGHFQMITPEDKRILSTVNIKQYKPISPSKMDLNFDVIVEKNQGETNK